MTAGVLVAFDLRGLLPGECEEMVPGVSKPRMCIITAPDLSPVAVTLLLTGL